MSVINTIDNDHWCKTDDVRDIIEVPDKGTEPDFESDIKSATNSVQSWYRTHTGNSSLPNSVPDLLVEATAWAAVSEASFTFGHNFSGQDNGGQQGRVRTAEQKAEKKFDEWKDQRDVDSGEVHTEGHATDPKAQSGTIVDEF